MRKGDVQRIEIPVPIYRCTVVIFFGVSAEHIVKVGRRRGIQKEAFTKDWISGVQVFIDNPHVCDGFCRYYGEKNTDILIWLRKRPRQASDYGVLYHEIYHAVDNIANSVDPADRLTDECGHSEARAHLFSFLATEANRQLWSR